MRADSNKKKRLRTIDAWIEINDQKVFDELGLSEKNLVVAIDALYERGNEYSELLDKIKEGLDKQTGLTRAQLIFMSDAIVTQYNLVNGTKLSREDLLTKTDDSFIANFNKELDDESREAECLLTGFFDALYYYKAAMLYADAGMADEARRSLAGARYWLPRILERGTK